MDNHIFSSRLTVTRIFVRVDSLLAQSNDSEPRMASVNTTANSRNFSFLINSQALLFSATAE